MKGRVWQRGDIVSMSFDPTLGHEQQGRRPAMVLTQAAFNKLGMIGVCPITQGGQYTRDAGMAVSLTGAGLKTVGVVLVHQFRMIDPKPRDLKLVECAPNYLTEEARARVAALLD